MADRDDKFEENKPGKFYVDTKCVECDTCRTEAPDNFGSHGGSGYSFIAKQPESEEEEAKCQMAKAACPVEAIGDDGLDE